MIDMKEHQSDIFDFDDGYSLYTQIQGAFIPGEDCEIEYKSGKDGFPKELWKTYSAFANTNTGIIVIGIKEKRGIFKIEGLTEEQLTKYKKQFWDNCNNPNTISRNLLKNEDINVIEVNEKKLLGIRVPFASRTERPVYLTRNPLGNTYKRNHEGDYRCTDDEVKRMLADSSIELKRDSLILENYTIDDLDSHSIRQFRQLFSSTRAGHPWLVLEDMDLLKKLGAYRKDRKTQQEGLTLAGLLMFGKADSIKEQEALPDYFPDYRERLSSDVKIRWTDRVYPDGSWECNLLQFYLRVWPKLSSTLPNPFRLDKDERVDESATHVALREAFVNALVHTDYSLSGNIIIQLDTEKFVFSNPGTLLVSIEQYYTGGVSECRNPALQQMFMMIGRAEKAGSGVDKIMSGWLESHWRRPFLELENQPDRVTLTLPMFSVIPESILNELNEVFEDVSHLNPDELTALSFCLIEGSISNHRLQYVLKMHNADITGMLQKLCKEGYLSSDNNGRWTIYELKRKVDSSNRKVATSSKNIDNQENTNKEVATSGKKVATSDKKVATPKVDTSIPKNMKKEDLEKIILKFCKSRYVKKEEIAEHVGRSENYIRNKILPRLLKTGKLEKHFPYTHNHPEQGYKTSEDYAESI